MGKILIVKKGHRLSRQYHRKKDETLYMDGGKCIFEVGRRKVILKEGESIRLKPGTIHRIFAKFGDIKIIETSTPHPNDRVRIDDDYGRKDSKHRGR